MRDLSKPQPAPNLILHCQICGSEVGAVYARTTITEDEYRTKGGIVDQRCSQCETDHGTFRDLLEDFKRETGDDEAKAEAFVVTYRKRAQFRIELDKEKLKRAKNRDIIT